MPFLNTKMFSFASLLAALTLAMLHQQTGNSEPTRQDGEKSEEVAAAPAAATGLTFGNFSVSLAVKDIKASKAFYEKLDFKPVGGKLEQRYLIMQNGTTTIGLFQGMFKDNIMTFNPGWNHKSETLKEFQDVRFLQSTLKKRGIKPAKEAAENSKGPASFVIVDPDGNSILVDQHVAKPK